MFVRTRTYGPNYSGKQPKAAQTDLKPTQTNPKSASTMPQDMHKLSARTRYQPRIGPVRPKLTRTGPNQPKPTQTNPNGIICVCIRAVCIRAVRGLINAQLDDTPATRRLAAVHSNSYNGPHDTATHAVAQAAVPVAHTARRFTRCFTRQLTAVHTAPRPSGPHGTATHTAQLPSGPRWFKKTPRRDPHDDSQRTLAATQRPTAARTTAPHGISRQYRAGTLSRRAVTRRGYRRHRGLCRRRAGIA